MTDRDPSDFDPLVAERFAGLLDLEPPAIWDRVRTEASSNPADEPMVAGHPVDDGGSSWRGRLLAAAAGVLVVAGVAAVAVVAQDGSETNTPAQRPAAVGDCPPLTVVDGEPAPTHRPECESIHEPAPLGVVTPTVVVEMGDVTLRTTSPIEPICGEMALVLRFDTDAFAVIGTLGTDGAWQPAPTDTDFEVCDVEPPGRTVTYRLPDALEPGQYRLCRSHVDDGQTNDPAIHGGCGDLTIRAAAPSTTPSPPSTPSTVPDETNELFRPYVADPDVCVPVAARETAWPAQGRRMRPFALGVQRWERFQIIADPDLEQNGPWALIGTVPDGTLHVPDEDSTVQYRRVDTINDWPVVIDTPPNGAGVALIDLGGDTDAYLRTTGFDPDSLRALIDSLAVRSEGEPVGFEFTPTDALGGLDVVLDVADDPVVADISWMECMVEGDATYRIGALIGDPAAGYVLPLDQPAPLRFGRIGDAVISISRIGMGDNENGPSPSDVINAPPDIWSELLQQPLPTAGPPSDTDNPGPTSTQTPATTSPIDKPWSGATNHRTVIGPLMRHPIPAAQPNDEMTGEIVGVLELDNACLYVNPTDIPERYPVLWPATTGWDEERQVVVLSTGDEIAVGQSVYAGGGYLALDDVERLAGSDAADLAHRCVDNTYREIAVINNTNNAIEPI